MFLTVFIGIVTTCCVYALFFFIPTVSPVAFLNLVDNGDATVILLLDILTAAFMGAWVAICYKCP